MTGTKEEWRILEDWGRAVPAPEGLAVDDMLAHAVSEKGSPPLLHLYTFEPSAIVGKYQDIRAALKPDRCLDRGVAFNRRSTGGGTVIMGPEVVALGFSISLEDPRMGRGIDGVFRVMSGILLEALGRLGVRAGFRPRNDLEVQGRKLAGLSACAETGNCVLFHASILVDFDVGLMLDIMNTPAEKMTDKGYGCFSRRITTIRAETGRRVTMKEAMEAIRESFADGFGIRWTSSSMTPWERETAARLEEERYRNPEWVFSHRHPRFRMGEALRKTPGGLLQVNLSLANHVIDQVVITGDFFAATEGVQRLESALKWTLAERDRILDAVKQVWTPGLIFGMDPETITEAVLAAGERCVNA